MFGLPNVVRPVRFLPQFIFLSALFSIIRVFSDCWWVKLQVAEIRQDWEASQHFAAHSALAVGLFVRA